MISIDMRCSETNATLVEKIVVAKFLTILWDFNYISTNWMFYYIVGLLQITKEYKDSPHRP